MTDLLTPTGTQRLLAEAPQIPVPAPISCESSLLTPSRPPSQMVNGRVSIRLASISPAVRSDSAASSAPSSG